MKTNIKMIITDLDRSLLNNERQISEYTRNIFQKCIKNNIIIVYATARPLRETKIYYDSIRPNAVICHCGAVVYINNKLFFQNGIGQNTAKDVLKNIIKEYPKADLSIESNDELFANFDLSKSWPGIVYKNMDIENLPKTIIDKIMVEVGSIENIDGIKKYLSQELYFEISEGALGMIMNKKATKWNGIKELMEHYKIEKENTISFGDDYSDIEMIKNCGIGIAVGNGIEEIKKSAKYICGTNENDGIARWVEENILEEGQNCI